MVEKFFKNKEQKNPLIKAKNKTKENNTGNLISTATMEAGRDVLKTEKSYEHSLSLES